MTADFQRTYGLRLIDAVESRTDTELLDLILWIGPDTSFAAARQDSKNQYAINQWSSTDDLLLTIVNLIQHQTYVLNQVNNPKTQKIPDEVVGPRGKKPAKKSNDANDTARALLRAQKAQKRG